MSKKEFVKIPLEFDTPVPFYNVGVSSTAEASFDEGVKAISDDTKPKSWQISATYFF